MVGDVKCECLWNSDIRFQPPKVYSELKMAIRWRRRWNFIFFVWNGTNAQHILAFVTLFKIAYPH